MLYRAIFLGFVLLASAGVSFSQEPSGRIDLDVVSRAPYPRLFVARVQFAGGQRRCPVDHGYLRVTKGKLWQTRTLPDDPRLSSNAEANILPVDDKTQRYRIESPTCRVDIDVRQQVRRDGFWAALHATDNSNENLPSLARREVKLEELTPVEMERYEAANKEENSAGSLALSVAIFGMGFSFDNRPQKCFEATGYYEIGRVGVIFSFLTGLPDNVNRFVVERADLDANRSRLSFTRDDCRFELTVSRAVLRHGRWFSLPLAPIR